MIAFLLKAALREEFQAAGSRLRLTGLAGGLAMFGAHPYF
jgi:hypothetical protein